MSIRRHSLTFRPALAALLLVGALVFVGAAQGALAQATSVTLQFEGQALDLDSGTLYPAGDRGVGSGSRGRLFYKYPEADIRLTYNPHRDVPTVVFQNQITGVEVAFLENTPFAEISDDDLLWLSLTAELVDRPFGPGDTIVVKTDTGAHFKLGQPVLDTATDPFTLTLDYERLDSLQSRDSRPDSDLGTAVASAPPRLSSGDWAQVRALLERASYRFETNEGTLTGSNAAHQIRIAFDEQGVSVVPTARQAGAWEWSLAARGIGYQGQVRPLERVRPVADGNRVEYRRGGLVEWFVNDERGLEQGFTLEQPPAEGGEGPLVVRLASRGSLRPQLNADAAEIVFAGASGSSVLSYGGLVAWDARGRDLPARMVAEDGGLRLEIDDGAAVYPVVIDPTIVNEEARLSTYYGRGGDLFGGSVAVSGDTTVVGANGPNDDCLRSGSAYLFVREDVYWNELPAALTAGDAGSDWDCFGISVAISDDTIVVGASGDDDNGPDSGAAYVFERSGGTWGAPTKVLAADGSMNDAFGVSVAISGQTIVVGANNDDDDGADSGSAYVFVRNGAEWIEQAKLTAGASGRELDFFGTTVAISGTTTVVGADADDDHGTDSGSVYVFAYNGADWSGPAKLTASDGAEHDSFGVALAVSGDTLVVGASGDDDNGTDTGSAYAFALDGVEWTLQGKLLPSEWEAFDLFGSSVALSGDTAVAGAPSNPFRGPGRAHVFRRDGDVWIAEAELEAMDTFLVENFGVSLALEGRTVVVGADGEDGFSADEENIGAAYVFQLEGQVNEPPVAVCQDVTVEAGDNCMADASVDGGSYDPDGDEVTLSQDPSGLFELGEIDVTLTVTDPSGETDSCTAIVTVVDVDPPGLTVDTTPIVVTDFDCSRDELVALPAATATDNCDPSPTVSNANGDGSARFGIGETLVTYTATDASGNETSMVLPVTVLPLDADNDGSFCFDDCNDEDPTVYPDAEELCDVKDNNCDGVIDEGWPDSDSDGYPDACDNCPEVANDGQLNWNSDELGDACQDFDEDGLLDETEIDLQTPNSAGCPYPNNADSDSDTLLDGEETDAGTDPCNADTDEDGVDDADDPTPTQPGVPGSWLEEQLREKATDVRGLDLQLFEGRTEVGKQARRTQLATRFDKSSNGVRKANVVTATEMLERARTRIDGELSPGDFMLRSPQKTELLDQTDLYLSLLEQM